jgi:hypothetical protein
MRKNVGGLAIIVTAFVGVEALLVLAFLPRR